METKRQHFIVMSVCYQPKTEVYIKDLFYKPHRYFIHKT